MECAVTPLKAVARSRVRRERNPGGDIEAPAERFQQIRVLRRHRDVRVIAAQAAVGRYEPDCICEFGGPLKVSPNGRRITAPRTRDRSSSPRVKLEVAHPP